PPENRLGTLDLYRLHPRLGVYPAELDFVYPFTQTVEIREMKGEGRGRESPREAGLDELKGMEYRKLLTAMPTRGGGKLATWNRKPGHGRRRRSPSPSSPSRVSSKR